MDATFGTGGVVETQVGVIEPGASPGDESAIDIVITESGLITEAGYAARRRGSRNITIVQLDENGALNTEFGDNGIAFVQSGNDSYAISLMQLADGRLAVTGQDSPPGSPFTRGFVAAFGTN
jgi:hypothetical protein